MLQQFKRAVLVRSDGTASVKFPNGGRDTLEIQEVTGTTTRDPGKQNLSVWRNGNLFAGPGRLAKLRNGKGAGTTASGLPHMVLRPGDKSEIILDAGQPGDVLSVTLYYRILAAGPQLPEKIVEIDPRGITIYGAAA